MSTGWQGIRKVAAVAVALAASVSIAGAAEAAPFDNAGYPRFAHEGVYPEKSGCKFRLTHSAKGSSGGRTISLRYYYSGRCGSFARIDNAPRDCKVWLDRTPDGDTVGGWDFVGETVDPGLDFAYTKVGNNLSGRLSRGALTCGPRNTVVVRTPWF